MKTNIRWFAIPTALVLALSSVGAVRSQSVSVAPFQSLGGTVNGGQKNCDQLSGSATHVVKLNQDFPNLRFSVSGSGKPIMKVVGPDGLNECVMAYSGGQVSMPGYWKEGSYSVFLGNLVAGSHNYNLSVK